MLVKKGIFQRYGEKGDGPQENNSRKRKKRGEQNGKSLTRRNWRTF